MGFLKRSLNFITHSQTLEDTINEYNFLLEKRDSSSFNLGSIVQELYEKRKVSLSKLNELKSYVDGLDNCPEILKYGVQAALQLSKNIEDAASWESNSDKVAKNIKDSSGVAIAGAVGSAVGGLTATVGSTTAMAIATTFGTASTGAAISSIGGAAATNAALAWLGGGALAAGGAGMAGGAAFLALLGPVGLSIGAVSAVGSSMIVRSRNDRQINEIKKDIGLLYSQIDKLSHAYNHVSSILERTNSLSEAIEIAPFENASDDYLDAGYPREELFDVVEKAKKLGRASKETINTPCL